MTLMQQQVSRLLIFLDVSPNSLELMYHVTSHTTCSHHAKSQAVQQIFHSQFIETYQNLILRIVHVMLVGNDVYISVSCTIHSKKWGGNVLHFKYGLCCMV